MAGHEARLKHGHKIIAQIHRNFTLMKKGLEGSPEEMNWYLWCDVESDESWRFFLGAWKLGSHPLVLLIKEVSGPLLL